jgi:hypothetical protein
VKTRVDAEDNQGSARPLSRRDSAVSLPGSGEGRNAQKRASSGALLAVHVGAREIVALVEQC